MTLSNDLSSYNGVRDTLDNALVAKGMRLELESPGQALYWSRRAYHFRKLLVRASMPPMSIYDDLVFTPDGNYVIIKIRRIQGTMYTLDGELIEPTSKVSTAITPATPSVLVEYDSDGNLTPKTKARMDAARKEEEDDEKENIL